MIKTKKRKIIIVVILVVIILSVLLSILFIGAVGPENIRHYSQSGVAYLTVFVNGTLQPANEYSIVSDLPSLNSQNGYKINSDYGEIRGIIKLKDKTEIEYGFFNTNNWHNIQIRLDIEYNGEKLTIRQVVTYFTIGVVLDVLVTESSGIKGNKISVYRNGI